MAFDPDEYLNEKGTSSTAKAEFDPDAYLSESKKPAATFDPDAYLSEVRPPTIGGLTVPPAPEAPKPRPIVETIGQLEGIKNAAMNAFDSSRQAMAVAGGVSPEEAEDISKLEYQKEARKLSPAYSEYLQAEGMDAVKAFAKNPFEITTNIVAEGLAGSLYSIGAGVAAGGVAAAATAATGVGAPLAPAAFLGGQIGGTFAGSLATEYGGKVLEELQKAGMDIKDPESIQKFFGDEKLMEGARSQALKRGVPVAIFDGVSAGIGGRLARLPIQALTKTPTRLAVTEAVTQAALGGGGEIAGAVAAGEEIQPKAVFGEVIGEVGPAAAEITVGRIAERLAKTPEQKQFDQNVLAAQVATRASQDIAPASADALERQVQDTMASAAETPEQRVVRLQKEAKAGAGIELEEETANRFFESARSIVVPQIRQIDPEVFRTELNTIETRITENAFTVADLDQTQFKTILSPEAYTQISTLFEENPQLAAQTLRQVIERELGVGGGGGGEGEPPVTGLPPVEPTPPVTPAPEAAVSPVEPVVPTEEVAQPPTPEAAPTPEIAQAAQTRITEREGQAVTLPEQPTGNRIEAAAYQAPDGTVYYGASHLDAMAKARDAGKIDQAIIDAKQETTSRETPEFGFATNADPFVTRDQAETIARQSGQITVEQPATGKLHSNEVSLDAFAQPVVPTPTAVPAVNDAEYLASVERGDNEAAQRLVDSAFRAATKPETTDSVFERHKDFKMMGLTLEEIAQNPEALAEKDKDDYDTVMYWVSQIEQGNTPTVVADEKGSLWDGFHRLVASKIAGGETINVFTSEKETSTDQLSQTVRRDAEGNVIPLSERFPTTPTAPTPTAEVAPAIPQLEPLRRVARAEQTEEDVAGLVDAGFAEVYKGQPVLTQAGLEALPEAERPRLTPEARKIQIDTRTSEAVAEAISKNLRIGVDQVPADVRMPAGWTLVGDVYVPPQPQEVGQEFTVYRGELPALEGGRQLAGIRDVGELMGVPDSATLAPFTYYSTSEQDARAYLERDTQILRDYQQRFGNEEGLKMFQSLHGFDPRTEGQMVSKKIRPRKVFDMTEMGTVADQFKMTELIAKEMGVTLPENWTWRDVPAEVQKEISDYGLDIVGDPDKKDPTWQYFRNTTERTRAALIARGLSQRTKEDVRGSLFAQWLRKNGYDAVAMMHDTAQGPVKHILVINEETAKAQEGLAPETAPEQMRIARVEPSDIETAVVPEEVGDVFANLVRRKQEVQPAVLQKPVGSQFQNPEEFRAAFDLRGQGHTRFAIRLDLMQEDGAITEDGKNLILATIWDNNTNDEFLSNMEMGSARKNVKSYGYGGRSRQTVEGGMVEQKPLLELIRATRRGGTEADKRTALTLNTFWHEFGHAGYYSLLDAKQKKAINDAYSKTTRAGRRAFFAEGKSDIENTPWFSKYYAKNESEWFAQSFAEYVITQKSDQKKLVPVFEQLLDKIKAVFTKLFNRKEQVNLNDIFDFILRGEAYGQRPTWQGYTMSTKPAVYGTPRGQAISPEFTKRLLALEQPTTFADERRQQIIDGISLKFKRSKNEYGNNEFKTEYDFGDRSPIVDKISFSLEQFDDSTVSISYLPSKGGKYVNIKLGELEQEFKGRAAAERAIKRAIAEVEMDERVGGATEPEPEAIPTFTEGTPEAATLKAMEASMAKVDSASEAKGGKPETQKISEIAANWMDQGGDERELQDAIVENTNLTPANAARVARAIARQYDIQQSIATAMLETPTGLSVEALPEGVTLPKEVDPDRPKPVMQRLFEVFMGVRVPPTKITVNEKTALKDQIRLKAAANRAAKDAQKATAAAVIETIKQMELRGPVRPKQAQALAKRAANVIWTSEKSVEAFTEYAAKVVENTNYDADVREAKAAQKRAKELSKQKTVAMSPQRQVLEDIGKISIGSIDDPRLFADTVNYYLRAFKKVTSPDYVVIPDSEMTSYLSQLENQEIDTNAERERVSNEKLAAQYGLPVSQVEALLNSQDIIRDLVAYAKREQIESILNQKIGDIQTALKAYDQNQLRPDQRKLVDSLLSIDANGLDAKEKQSLIRIGNNVIYNNQTNGAQYFVAVANGQQNARQAAQDFKTIEKNRAWIDLIPTLGSKRAAETMRNWSLELQSVADTFRNIFGKESMAKIFRQMGMYNLDRGFTDAANTLDQIQEKMAEFYKKNTQKYKKAARDQNGILSEGVVGFLIQQVPAKGEAESIAQRRDLIKQDIANRRSSRQSDKIEMANRIEEILGKVDGNTVEEILANMKANYRPNYDSLTYLMNDLLPQYKDFLKQFDENFNDQANNYDNPYYLPIAFIRSGPELEITPESESMFYEGMSLRPRQAANTIKRVDYSVLPKDKSGNPKEIQFNLRRGTYDSLSDQINKAYTNEAWQQIFSFMKTADADAVFGGRANKDFMAERLNRLRISRMRRGSANNGAISKFADSISVLARKIGTGIALGGVFQVFKQSPDQLISAIGTTGRYDLLGEHVMTIGSAKKLLDKFSIGRRGDASSGYKYINQMEGAQNRLERAFTESRWSEVKENASKVADVWMLALKKTDFLCAAGAWMTYYRANLDKNGIKFEGWDKEAQLVDTDPSRQDAASYAEQMTDIYQGSSDPTKMATFAQSGKSGWENFVKATLVPFNSFAVQQRMRIYSDGRDSFTKAGETGALGRFGLASTIGGLVAFHTMRRLVLPTITGAGVYALYAMLGVDMDEPDEEKKKEEARKTWRQFQGELLANTLVGGAPQFVEAATIDAFNYANYLVSLQLESEDIIDDNGEIMDFAKYQKERSPFWRYQSFKNAPSFGMFDVGFGQAEKVAVQTKQLMDREQMEMYTPEEQRLLYFSTLSEWLYLMRLNDADFARMVGKARRDMIKAVEDREKQIKAIREGR